MRLVILGGGGFRVPLVYRALVARRELGVDEVVLFDVDPGRLAVIAAVLEPAPGIRVTCTDSLSAALAGADVVFSAIRVGGPAGRVRDERRALRLGVLGQETVGAGGLSFGLRTLPVVLRAAALQAEMAPEAWLINFTNPAGLITQALSTVLGDKVIGICDSPVGLVRRACRALGLPPGDVQYEYAGINHLGWLTALRHGGRDVLPDLLADDTRLDTTEEGRLFDHRLLRSLQAIPNEYLYFYYAATEVTAQLAGTQTRGEVVERQQEEFYRLAGARPGQARREWDQARRTREETYLAEARDRQREDVDTSGGGYEQVALDIAQAVTSDTPTELIANGRNGSAFPQLPAHTVVETRCRLDGAGAHPLPGPALPLHQLGLIASVRAAEESIIEAAVHGDRDAAVHGFAVHPLVGSRRVAEALVASIVRDEPEVAALFDRPGRRSGVGQPRDGGHRPA